MQTAIQLKALDQDIRTYPVKVKIPKPSQKSIVIGDLHGNAMKLLHLLLFFNVIDINENDFNNAWLLYNKNTNELTQEDLNQFENIINTSQIVQRVRLIFLGDEFADRGNNDFFTALIFKRLHDAEIQYKIHLSNHGTYLLSYLEHNQGVLANLCQGQLASLDNFIALKERIPTVGDKFNELVEHAYKDHLCLLGYTQANQDVPILFSHAPIDNITLQNLANKFN